MRRKVIIGGGDALAAAFACFRNERPPERWRRGVRLKRIFNSRAGNCRTRLWLLLMVAACAATASGQATRRVVVETNSSLLNYPVELVGAEVAGGAHDFAEGEPGRLVAAFEAPDDWLRRFTLKLRNKTDKTILSATLNGSLAVGEDGEIPMGFELRFGQELDESAFTGRPPRGVPGHLSPGETGGASWSEAEYAEMEKFLSLKHRVSDYRRMRISLQDVRFDDGTVWTINGLFRIDSLDPRKWTPVDKQPKSAAPEPELKAGERIVEVSSFKNESDPYVIEITGIEVAGRPITPGRPFAAGDDWLLGLTVRVKNVSAKPITYLQLSLSFPEAHYHSGGVGYTLRYGRNGAGVERDAPDAKLLAPGEEALMIFTGGEFYTFKSFAERLSGGFDFHRLRLGTAFVRFEDGTRANVINPARAQKPTPPPVKNN
ncbi:MAG: hypothetical protein M3444_02440 [Acidobacteriota bacterium]|nr:hypothetical protein [Acidobacteriota bacterium]